MSTHSTAILLKSLGRVLLPGVQKALGLASVKTILLNRSVGLCPVRVCLFPNLLLCLTALEVCICLLIVESRLDRDDLEKK